MRFRRRLILLAVVFVLAVCSLYLLQDVDIGASDTGVVCDVGDAHRAQLFDILQRVLSVISAEGVRPFLCYDSLWGALKQQAPYRWTAKVSLCSPSEQLEAVDELYLRRRFTRVGLDAAYDGRNGLYRIMDTRAKPDISKPYPAPMVELILFEQLQMGIDERDTEPQLRRIGWLYRLMPPTSERIDKFPQRLVVSPPDLPTTAFGRLKEVPVPRETLEIQKYHFRDTWWKESRPAGC